MVLEDHAVIHLVFALLIVFLLRFPLVHFQSVPGDAMPAQVRRVGEGHRAVGAGQVSDLGVPDLLVQLERLLVLGGEAAPRLCALFQGGQRVHALAGALRPRAGRVHHPEVPVQGGLAVGGEAALRAKIVPDVCVAALEVRLHGLLVLRRVVAAGLRAGDHLGRRVGVLVLNVAGDGALICRPEKKFKRVFILIARSPDNPLNLRRTCNRRMGTFRRKSCDEPPLCAR